MNSEVRSYFDGVPSDRRAHFNALHELILSVVPKAKVDLSYKMPTYKMGDGWVALANQKNYISLYTCGAHHLQAFKKKHPMIKTGKGCINLKPGAELPAKELRDVVRHAIESPKNV